MAAPEEPDALGASIKAEQPPPRRQASKPGKLVARNGVEWPILTCVPDFAMAKSPCG